MANFTYIHVCLGRGSSILATVAIFRLGEFKNKQIIWPEFQMFGVNVCPTLDLNG